MHIVQVVNQMHVVTLSLSKVLPINESSIVRNCVLNYLNYI
jgi:hypothetical protein